MSPSPDESRPCYCELTYNQPSLILPQQLTQLTQLTPFSLFYRIGYIILLDQNLFSVDKVHGVVKNP